MALVFLVPIRHPEDCRDPDAQRQMLAELFASIAAQTHPDWRAVIVVNPSQRLPDLPPQFSVAQVSHGPNTGMQQAGDQASLYRAIRRDKGLRVRRGLQEVAPEDTVFVTDDDDLVSNRLAGFIAEHSAAGGHHGWYVDAGYTWKTGDDHLRAVDHFHTLCGTSLLCPPGYYDAYRDSDPTGDAPSTEELGSHRMVFEKIRQGGQGRFAPLPFRGAIYRLAHDNATQVDLTKIKRSGLFDLRKRPLLSKQRLRDAGRLLLGSKAERQGHKVPLDAALKAEFFAPSTADPPPPA